MLPVLKLPAAGGVPDEIGERFTIGKITVDRQERTIRFPATVNLSEGGLEYLLVTDEGKTHESLLATPVSPYNLNVAMLLLGVMPNIEIKELPPTQITASSLQHAPELTGTNINILVTWKGGSNLQQLHAEELINNRLTQAPMTTGVWVYNGSAIYKKRLLAQEESSIVALVTDPAALINNPRPGNKDDTVWSPRSNIVPAVGTSVEITFQLLSNDPPSAPVSNK